MTPSDIHIAIQAINEQLDNPIPEIAIILGSGLGCLSTMLESSTSLAYNKIPGFSTPSVSGHGGHLVYGNIAKRNVIFMQGRSHTYETGNPACMGLAIRTLKALGCKKILLTCAAGSLNKDAGPGSLLQITDHINLTGLSPLTGEQGDNRFVDLTQAYSENIRNQLNDIATKQNVALKEGVYMWFPGPNFETPAEIKAAKVLGADAVGMSIVPETIIARHAGLEVGALAIITNYAAGISDQALTHEHTLKAAKQTQETLQGLLMAYLSLEA
jgi:purine-nucleoside phosphorylase